VFAIAAARSQVNVIAGGAHVSFGVTVNRGSFGGDVAVTATGLPPGVKAYPLTIPAGLSGGYLVFEAAPDAPLGPSQITLATASEQTTVTLLVQGEPGTVDGTLGPPGGTGVSVQFPNMNFLDVGGEGLTVRSDGKILVCGTAWTGDAYTVALAQLDDDGSPDVTFAAHGLFTQPDTSYPWTSGESVISTGTGVVVAGFASYSSAHTFAVLSLRTDGSPVPGFGAAGWVYDDVPFSDPVTPAFDSKASSVLVQPDGKLVLAGFGGSNYQTALLRLLADGSPEVGFGGADDGGASFVGPPRSGNLSGIGMTRDGGFVSVRPGPNASPVVDRFTASGTLDPSFGNAGEASGVPGTVIYNSGGQVALQPDDKAVVLTTLVGDAGTGEGIAVARFDAAGKLDVSFGQGGVQTTVFPGYQPEARVVKVAPDGAILVGVTLTSTATGNASFGLARYTPRGVLDPSFAGGQGYVATPLAWPNPRVEAIAVDPYGRILLAGAAQPYPKPPGLGVVVRYWP
jgi:uncharacterized delta-60 repeat protein